MIGTATIRAAPIAKAVEHVPFGLVLSKTEDGKWEKFASRSGNAVFLDYADAVIVGEAIEVVVEAVAAQLVGDLAQAPGLEHVLALAVAAVELAVVVVENCG